MNKLFLILLANLLLTHAAVAQIGGRLPELTIQDLQGRDFNTKYLENDGKPFVVSFWATWCRPCIQELNAIDEIYEDWKDYGFKVVAVSTDDARTRPNVLPMVSGRGWEFEFYLDENADFRRAMGVNLVPHTFILNRKGEIVYQHTSFSDGMEWEMFDMLIDLLDDE